MSDKIKELSTMLVESAPGLATMEKLCEVLKELSDRVEELELRLEAADELFEEIGDDVEALGAFTEGALSNLENELETRLDDHNDRISALEGGLE